MNKLIMITTFITTIVMMILVFLFKFILDNPSYIVPFLGYSLTAILFGFISATVFVTIWDWLYSFERRINEKARNSTENR